MYPYCSFLPFLSPSSHPNVSIITTSTDMYHHQLLLLLPPPPPPPPLPHTTSTSLKSSPHVTNPPHPHLLQTSNNNSNKNHSHSHDVSSKGLLERKNTSSFLPSSLSLSHLPAVLQAAVSLTGGGLTATGGGLTSTGGGHANSSSSSSGAAVVGSGASVASAVSPNGSGSSNLRKVREGVREGEREGGSGTIHFPPH